MKKLFVALYYFVCNIYYICARSLPKGLAVAEKNRILLVDDEPDVVYLVKRGLERNGFEVDGYTDPLLALQHFKGGVYSLLLLDIKMPKIDGIELFNIINKEDDNVKVCFFSASDSLSSSLKNNFHNSPDKFLFISKPISIIEMTKQIKQFFN
jgi:DNA-binding response OmpR family regulator